LSDSCREVLRTDSGSNRADSSKTLTVAAETSLSSPPITPASATGRMASAITSISGASARSFPSMLTSFSPGRAWRTDNAFPSHLIKVERMKRLSEFEHHIIGHIDDIVIDRSPTASRRRTIQAGLGPTSHGG